jgi:SAM-dependent methyltransferase
LSNSLKSNLIDAYNKKAYERDLTDKTEWKLAERANFLAYFKKNQLTNLLEIGAGTGKDSLYFKENGIETFSIDLSPEMVKMCKSKGLNAEQMSFDELKFNDQTFDSVWSLNCLLHVPKKNLKDTLIEIKRVLRSNGLMYLGVYGGKDHEGIFENDSYEPKRFFSFYEDEQIIELLSDLFKIEYLNILPPEVIGGQFNFQSFILRKID